ncbi:MAG TPA: phenylalanine--tRNA ligase subunit beta [Myxococcaceae bacterium]|nr:phenylalanine--tRNA ligase subunit beta [Myxococcaceae bacterium]
MEISLEWLKDYVPVEGVEQTAARLTDGGLEVEGIRHLGEGLDGVLVAEVKEAVPHPDAERLQVTQVDIGASALLQVVCGAKNFKVGDKVPLATVGSELPGGMKIGRAALRGVDSFGMLCSAKELGLPEGEDGLLILDSSLKPGVPIVEALGLDDSVLTLNVTPNRPDALSHVGVARDLAVLTGTRLTLPPTSCEEGEAAIADALTVRIEAGDRCARYAARVIEGVKVGPSPAWLSRRLEACGVRSINNIVDVTNFVLLELGHPLHAFDLDRLAEKTLVVRTAAAGETLKTLDGKERKLEAGDLVIADAARAQALAGVMGGAESEVGEATTRIVLESAWFAPEGVRRTARRHALHSEASHRFERGADPEIIPVALDRAARLIAELAGGTIARGRIDEVAVPHPPREVMLRDGSVSRLLGVEVPAEEVRRILTALGFSAQGEQDGATRWRVPSHRPDVTGEVDLVEEVARIRGYATIPSVLPRGGSALAPPDPAAVGTARLRAALSGLGHDEVINYAFTSEQALRNVGETGDVVTLLNPLSAEQGVMRTSLLPGLLENLSLSVRHQVERLRIYEIGRTYHRDPQGGQGQRPAAREVNRLGGLLYGLRAGRSWSEGSGTVDFYDAKGAVEGVLSALHIHGARFTAIRDVPSLHPGAAAAIHDAEGQLLGTVGQLHPRVARAADVPEAVFVFDLDLARLLARATLVPLAQALPRFPAVLRDLSVVVPREHAMEAVRQLILEEGGALVEDAALFDVYTGQNIPEGHRSLAFAIRYRSPERTLQDAEVTEAHQRIVERVHERLGASLRA